LSRNLIVLALSLMSSSVLADVPVIDATNLAVARENAENTGEIMRTNADILEKSKEILKALSGSRDGSMGIGSEGLAGGMTVSGAPSFGSVMNGGTLSFGNLSSQAQEMAAMVINGLQLVKTVKAIVEGEDPGAANNAYSSAVNTAALLSALTSQASAGVTAREQSLQSASGQIGEAEDVKGSVDANTKMQLETARTMNELIGVSNGAVSAMNQEMQFRLTQQSETAKMMKYKDVNPFKDAGN
jgi:cytochrome b